MAIYGSLGGQDSTSTGYPSIRPTLDLNFAQTKTLDPRVTFYRDSLGTYVDSQGIIRTVTANVPRFDHNPITGESLGLLIEESRTNLELNSQDFTQSNWTKTNCSINSINNTIAPDGTLTANKIAESTGTITSGGVVYAITGTNNGITYTISVYAKAAGRNYLAIDGYLAPYQTAIFNLSNGTVTTSAGVSCSIVSVGNGWYRCIFVITSTGYTGGPSFRFQNDVASTSYTGDGNSGIYLWGAQVEAGSFPTSYIPTSGSAVTRSADTAYMDGVNLTSWYSILESTMFIQASNDYFGSFSSHAGSGIELHSGVFQSQMIAFGGKRDHLYYPAGLLDIFSSSGASVYGGGPVNTRTNASIVYKTAYAYKSGSLAVSADGYNAGTSSSTFTHPTITRLQFGSNFYAYDPFNGKISRLMYYPKTLTASQLKNLTAL
jgi:hypothetical protein